MPLLHADRDGTHVLAPVVAAQPPRAGSHAVEWLCEFVGTAILVGLGLSVVVATSGSASPIHTWPLSDRLLLNGLWFAGVGSLIAVSPIGRRSGAHLNPIVTLAFWTQGKVHRHDLAGYLVAQLAGGIVGAALLLAVWQGQARSVDVGATVPGGGIGPVQAVLLEAGMSGLEVLVILGMTSSPRTARWTPLALWLLNATLVWRFAGFTGTSLNPARSLGPALLAPALDVYWIYLLGPGLGMLLGVALFALAPRLEVRTTKLFHDPAYPSTMASSLPVAEHC
jgi:aquaporin Z